MQKKKTARAQPRRAKVARKPARKKSAPPAASAARSDTRRALYPAIEPMRHGYFRVSDIHEIYY
jgi:hypothetical protein